MKAYLDNSATTFIAPEVLAELKRIYSQVPGNPSSLYSLGMEAEQELKRSRSIIAGFLGVQAKEIYFTSGALRQTTWPSEEPLPHTAGRGSISLQLLLNTRLC